MTIRRRCTERNCKNGRRCLEHLRFDVMFRGRRYRIPANEFAIPRMDPGKQRPIQSMEEARDWERMFIGEVKAGRDPLRPRSRTIQAGTDLGDVSAFLGAYLERCVKPAGLRSISAIRSRVSVLKEHLGTLRLPALEEPDEINRFKTESEYAEDVEIATIHRVLETLRAAMNWGMAQTPPLFNRSPFHRFGVRLNKKAETARDRRLTRGEERRLLDAAVQKMNTAEHQFVGSLLHDRIIGALELCCRRGEMLMIQNKRVNWETCQIGIPGATTKDKENRRIPFNPKGRVAAILKRRAALGADVRVRERNRNLPAKHPDRLGNPATTRARHRAEADEGGSAMESRATRGNRPPMARPASRGRVSAARRRRRHQDHSAHARTREHSANSTLPERDGRRTEERTGGELEKQRPTASPGVGKLIDLVSSPDCPRFVPGNARFWLRGRATSGTCSCGRWRREKGREFRSPLSLRFREVAQTADSR